MLSFHFLTCPFRPCLLFLITETSFCLILETLANLAEILLLRLSSPYHNSACVPPLQYFFPTASPYSIGLVFDLTLEIQILRSHPRFSKWERRAGDDEPRNPFLNKCSGNSLRTTDWFTVIQVLISAFNTNSRSPVLHLLSASYFRGLQWPHF